MDIKKTLKDFWYGKPHGERRLGELYEDKTGLYKHREWRGVKDTMYYFYNIWLYNYIHMVADVIKLGGLVNFAKGVWRYRWVGQTYLPVLHWFDRGLEGLRGEAMKASAWHYRGMVNATITQFQHMFVADTRLHGNKQNEAYKHTIAHNETIWGGVFYPWSDKFENIPIEMIPYFVTCHVNSHTVLNYIDAVQSIGLPGDPCPMCQAEAGIFVLDDVPDYSPMVVTCNEACDASVATSILQDWFFDKPLFVLPMPMQFDDPLVKKHCMKEIEELWKFIEEQTGVPFNCSSGRSGMSLQRPTTTPSTALLRLCIVSISLSTAIVPSGMRAMPRFARYSTSASRRRSTPSRRPATESSHGPALRCTTPTGAPGLTTAGV